MPVTLSKRYSDESNHRDTGFAVSVRIEDCENAVMTVATAPKVHPFKGPLSFGGADRGTFFGRDNEARRVREMVLAHTMSLLHAPSGAGKTSMLHAALVPALEENHNWVALVVKPKKDILKEVQNAVCERLFPEPSKEVIAIDTLISASRELHKDLPSESVLGPDTSVRSAFETFALLNADFVQDAKLKQRVLELFAREEGDWTKIARNLAHFSDRVLSRHHEKQDPKSLRGDQTLSLGSVFMRSITYDRGIRLLIRHIACLATWCQSKGLSTNWLAPAFPEGFKGASAKEFANTLSDTSLAGLRECFKSVHLSDAHAEFYECYSTFNTSLPETLQMLQNDWFALEVFGCSSGVGLGPAFGFVIILDQFEEVFSQKHYLKGGESYDRLEDFFDQLSELYNTRLHRADTAAAPSAQFHILISMRDEHIAQLDRLSSFSGDVGRASSRLKFFERDVMKAIVKKTCRRYVFSISESVVDEILEELGRHDDSLEPVLVQIVLSRIWSEYGGALYSSTQMNSIAEISDRQFEEMGGTGKILNTFLSSFAEFDGDRPRSRIERFEIFTILQSLIGEGRRRKIEEESTLLDQVGHSRAARELVIDQMDKHRIIRREERVGSDNVLVEISHEGLCRTVDDVLRQEFFADIEFLSLQNALVRLEGITLSDARDISSNLMLPHELYALTDQHSAKVPDDPNKTPRYKLNFSSKDIEVILRSTVLCGAPQETFKFWGELFNESEVTVAPYTRGEAKDQADPDIFSLRALSGGDIDAGALKGLSDAELKSLVDVLVVQSHGASDAKVIEKFVMGIQHG